jgi:hypothetical protein
LRRAYRVPRVRVLTEDQTGLYAIRMVRHANKGPQIISAVSDYTPDKAKLPVEASFRSDEKIVCKALTAVVRARPACPLSCTHNARVRFATGCIICLTQANRLHYNALAVIDCKIDHAINVITCRLPPLWHTCARYVPRLSVRLSNASAAWRRAVYVLWAQDAP